MTSEVLIDSNVYIDLLRARKDVISTLFKWSRAEGCNLAICGLVRVEVLRGLQSLRAFRELSGLMDLMINIPSDNRLWTEAADLAWSLDRKGIVIPATEAIIAASALKAKVVVMTSDGHFLRIDGLQVIAPPEEWFQ